MIKQRPTRAQKRAQNRAVKKLLRRIPKDRSQPAAEMGVLKHEADKLSAKARNLRLKSERILRLSRVGDLVRRLNAAAVSKQPIELIKAEGRRYVIQMIGKTEGTIRSEFVKAFFDIEKATSPDFFFQFVLSRGAPNEAKARQRAVSVLNSIASDAFKWTDASNLATKKFLGKKWDLGGKDIENTFSDPIMTIAARSRIISRRIASMVK